MDSDDARDVVERLENIEECVEQLKDDIGEIKSILFEFRKYLKRQVEKQETREKEAELPNDPNQGRW